jgi:hypothetical protein
LETSVKLPNNEIANELKYKLVEFYRNRYQISFDVLKRASDSLRDFIMSEDCTYQKELKSSLKNLFADFSFDKVTNSSDNDKSVHQNEAYVY